jgi:ribosomal protein S18 acetylase RimI-like enzyme
VALGGSLRVHRATPEDVEAAAIILEEATEWLAAKGLVAWDPDTFRSPGGWGRRILQEAQKRGHLFVLLADEVPVGTVTLQPTDSLFWPDAAEDALYVHRLAVSGDAHGQGLGRFLLRCAEQRAVGTGTRFLRLDCLAENRVLRRYYEDFGFEHCREVVVEGRAFSLYEKPVPVPSSD